MGIFDKIKNAIWGNDEEAKTENSNTRVAPTVASSSAPRSPVPSGQSRDTTSTISTQATQPSTADIDVAAMLDAAVKRKGQKLDWRHSIVDLMKALDLDSSLINRKELASELNYSGDTGNSAEMNMWLHKALMRKLAQNGGLVPPELMG